MKRFLIIIIASSSFAARSQAKNDVKTHHPKIKNGNVLIVPDQKPVIIERREEPVIEKRKENPVIRKNGLPPGQAKKLYRAKSARPFAPGQRKKAVRAGKNKRL